MSDDYLWDGSGEPDVEIQRLETLLGHFRHRVQEMEFASMAYGPTRPTIQWQLWIPSLLAATAIIAIVAVIWFPHRWPNPTVIPGRGWTVESLAGAPRLGAEVIGTTRQSTKFIEGQTLETDSRSRANITIADTGEVEVDPDSRLRLVGSMSTRKHLALDRGTIHAMIWAPPGEFVVDTPSAVAVDLGCAYSLHVDDSGAGLVRTTFGWVGFKFDGHESFVPAGAVCLIRPNIGPGTPCFEDATQQFRAALSKLDFDNGIGEQRNTELSIVLSQSRKRDALTLWHLLSRVNESERGRVYDRLALLVPPPPHVNRAGVLRLDGPMLDLWWNELNLGDMSLWRTWERSWSDDRSR